MKFPVASPTLDSAQLSPDEVADLALKFYQDSNCLDGHERENWLCAEYMLTQKKFIENKICSIHQREHDLISK